MTATKSEGTVAVSASSTPALPIEQLAAILAAEQDGFSLHEILAVEGVGEEAWQQARASLLPEIVEDVETHSRYQSALIDAQDRLACTISPLQDDVRAWVAFLRVADTQPMQELLDEHGLTPNDVARLQRHWQSRFASDSSLAKQASGLRKAEPPPELGTLQIGKRELVPSPYASGPKGQPDADDAGVDEVRAKDAPLPEVVDIGQMARLYTALEAGEHLDEVIARHGFSDLPAAQASMAAWKVQLEADATVRTDFMALVNHQRRRQDLARAAKGAVSASCDRATGGPLTGPPSASSHASQVDSRKHQPSVPLAPPSGAAATPPGLASVDETAAIDLSILAVPPLPFAATLPRPTVDETCGIDSLALELPVLPFGADQEGEEPASHDLDGTCAVIPALRNLSPLPWTTDLDHNADAHVEPKQSEVELPVSVEETAFIQALPSEPTLPFVPSDNVPATDPVSAERSFVSQSTEPSLSGDDGREGDPSPPSAVADLTVEQYASYCVERIIFPSRLRAIGARYRVGSELEHQQLARLWKRRLSESAVDRQRWQTAFERYRAHLLRSGSLDD